MGNRKRVQKEKENEIKDTKEHFHIENCYMFNVMVNGYAVIAKK